MNENKQYLVEACKAVHAKLPDNHGFILLVIEHGDARGKRLRYMSSLERGSAIQALKRWLFEQGEEENWIKHIQ